MIKNLRILAAILLTILFSSCADEMNDVQPAEEETAELKNWNSSTGDLYGDDRTDGNNGGKFWTVYKSGGWGKIKFPNGGGNFEIEYGDNGDIVGGKGWETGTTGRTIGYNIGSQTGQYAFVGVYGWIKKGTTKIEYYINERKNGNGGGTIGGTNKNKDFSSNGKDYKFLVNNRNAPNAYGGGSTAFTQFISENKSNIGVGGNQSISMSNHFSHWASNGGKSGNWNSALYQVFGVENFNGGYGKINATVW